MAKKTNCVIGGKEYYKINRKVGKKQNKHGEWVNAYKTFYGSSKKEAEAKYDVYMRNQTGSVNDKCIGEIIDEWISTNFLQSDLAEGTKRRYLDAYNNLFRCKKIAGKKIEDISPLDLQTHYNNPEFTRSTVKALHNLLRRFYRYAELTGLHRDITNCIKPPKAVQKSGMREIEVWDNEEIKKVIAALEGRTLRFLIIMAANTGMRIGELLALTYSDIENGFVTVNKAVSETHLDGSYVSQKVTKTVSSNRVIPLSDAVLKEFEIHKKLHKAEMIKEGYITHNIFTTSTGKLYYQRNVRRALERLYKRIGIQGHHFHCFRDTFATNLSNAGVPIEETSALLGHSDITVTAQYYVHINADRKRDAVEKIAACSL